MFCDGPLSGGVPCLTSHHPRVRPPFNNSYHDIISLDFPHLALSPLSVSSLSLSTAIQVDLMD